MDFLKMIFIDIFTKDWIGIFVGVFLWATTILVVGLVLCGVLYLVDSSFLPLHKGYGKVISLNFTPAHTTTTMVHTGKVTLPCITHHPDAWSVTVDLQFGSDSIRVKQQFYETLKINDRVKVGYVHGRISNNIYIKEIYEMACNRE
jgi:hypothetical protein